MQVRGVWAVSAAVMAAGAAWGASWECEHGCAHQKLARTGMWAPDHSPDDEDRVTELWWDSATGADRRNFPPDRLVDHERMRLEIDIPDMNAPRFTARQTLRFTPIARPLETLRLDAEQLGIDVVQWAGGGKGPGIVAHSYDGATLQLSFEPPIPAGETREVEIRFSVDDPADGLFWTPESPAWPGRPAQIHTQGQPNTNRWWFPCHDSPNERLETELVVTVPDPYMVSANGKLVSKKSSGGRTTWHWEQAPDHCAYLVSLCVGQWDVVDVGRGEIEMPVYAPLGRGGDVERTYGRTLDMVRVFEDRFGVEYPWVRYAQLVVWNFGAGGMENTSATTMFDTAIWDQKALLDGDLDGLISHELGHQWFGDLITCESWADIWLNEGFATYTEALWFEERDGMDAGYLWDMYSNVRGAARRDRVDPKDARAGLRPAMSSPAYRHPDDVFGRSANPYPKGASVLHMLRMRLGDDVFFRGLREYTRRYAGKVVETSDFRNVMEEVSGLGLAHFFDQWVHRPGTPEVTVKTSWNAEKKELRVVAEQTQRIAHDTPAFVFELPLVIESGGERRTVVIDVSERRHERAIPLGAEPSFVAVDPTMTVLMTPTLEMPASWLIAQSRADLPLPARADAVKELRRKPGAATASALRSKVGDTSEHFLVRGLAAESLGELKEAAALVELLSATTDDARVRRALVDGLRAAALSDAAKAAEALPELRRLAGADSESYATRAAALRAVGRLGEAADLGLFKGALGAASQNDQVRQAALEAIGELGHKDGLAVALPYTRPGTLNRTRPVAISAVAKLAEHDRDGAYAAVSPLLYDREVRTRAAAMNALVEIADERGLEELRRMSETLESEEERRRVKDAADRLAGALSRDGSEESLRTELGRLKREVEGLKAEVEKR